MAGEIILVVMHYALCIFNGKTHWTSTVPTRTSCNFKNMHFRHMHYNNFNCKGQSDSVTGATVLEMVKNLCGAAALLRLRWRSLVTLVTTLRLTHHHIDLYGADF
jgi:hypothetical protein